MFNSPKWAREVESPSIHQRVLHYFALPEYLSPRFPDMDSGALVYIKSIVKESGYLGEELLPPSSLLLPPSLPIRGSTALCMAGMR